MQFDDRLATAMRIGDAGPVMARIELRQLLDLLGSSPAQARSQTIEAAYQRVAQLAQAVPAGERARMLADPGLRLRSARLVAWLSSSEQDVTNAAIIKATLTDNEWLDLIPAIPPAARAAMRRRGGLSDAVLRRLDAAGAYERGLPPANQVTLENPTAPSAAPSALPPNRAVADVVSALDNHAPGEGISAIVRRIEAYRKARLSSTPATAQAQSEAPLLPLGDAPGRATDTALHRFDFATEATGRIIAADAAAAPMVVGLALIGLAGLETLVRLHQPITAKQVTLNGAVSLAGAWQIDAVPHFANTTGSFTGYHGRMRRAETLAAAPVSQQESEADRIRQLLHELRTPVNAIQGFAEVIQQQLFGPTPHEYRALAASIAGDAARILAAFEELERLARLEGGSLTMAPGSSDFVATLHATALQLEVHTAQRSVAITFAGVASGQSAVPLDAADSERLAWRLLATLGGAAAPGETLRIAVARTAVPDPLVEVTIDLPAALRMKSEQQLFEAGVGAIPQAVMAGVFGVGFALRLACAEARAAGGGLTLVDEQLVLRLPDLTPSEPGHSAAAFRSEK